MNPQNNPQNNSRKFQVTAAAIITTITGILGFYFTYPKPFCQLGITFLNSCPASTQEIQFVVRDNGEKPLVGVSIIFIGKNAPEKVLTDDNGYVKLKIASDGDIKVNLSKEGYVTQNFTLNLDDLNRVKIIDFQESGKPKVIATSEVPPILPVIAASPIANPIATSSTTTVVPSPTVIDRNVTWELKSCVRAEKNVRCTFSASISQDGRYGIYMPVFVDTDGIEHRSSLVQIANYRFSDTWSINMVINANYKVTFDFPDVPTSVTKIISLKASGYSGSDGITFRDIPIN
jgi:hypothetical protein